MLIKNVHFFSIQVLNFHKGTKRTRLGELKWLLMKYCVLFPSPQVRTSTKGEQQQVVSRKHLSDVHALMHGSCWTVLECSEESARKYMERTCQLSCRLCRGQTSNIQRYNTAIPTCRGWLEAGGLFLASFLIHKDSKFPMELSEVLSWQRCINLTTQLFQSCLLNAQAKHALNSTQRRMWSGPSLYGSVLGKYGISKPSRGRVY